MSTQKQVIKTVASLVNEKVDFKFVPEGLEQVIFEAVTARLLEFIVDRVGLEWDAVAVVISSAAQLSDISAGEVNKAIISELNGVFDIPFFDEEQEQMIISTFINILLPLLKSDNKAELVKV